MGNICTKKQEPQRMPLLPNIDDVFSKSWLSLDDYDSIMDRIAPPASEFKKFSHNLPPNVLSIERLAKVDFTRQGFSKALRQSNARSTIVSKPEVLIINKKEWNLAHISSSAEVLNLFKSKRISRMSRHGASMLPKNLDFLLGTRGSSGMIVTAFATVSPSSSDNHQINLEQFKLSGNDERDEELMIMSDQSIIKETDYQNSEPMSIANIALKKSRTISSAEINKESSGPMSSAMINQRKSGTTSSAVINQRKSGTTSSAVINQGKSVSISSNSGVTEEQSSKMTQEKSKSKTSAKRKSKKSEPKTSFKISQEKSGLISDTKSIISKPGSISSAESAKEKTGSISSAEMTQEQSKRKSNIKKKKKKAGSMRSSDQGPSGLLISARITQEKSGPMRSDIKTSIAASIDLEKINKLNSGLLKINDMNKVLSKSVSNRQMSSDNTSSKENP